MVRQVDSIALTHAPHAIHCDLHNQILGLTLATGAEALHVEKLLPELETEKAQLEALLSGGATQADDIAKASKRYQEVQNALDEAELRWLELSEVGE